MKVGFIGLGLMGSSMSLNVHARGHEVTVNDIRRAPGEPHVKAGCAWADSAREVAAASELVFTSLPGPKEVEAVAEELLTGMRKGSAWFDLSTNSPTVVRRLHGRFAAQGIALLDAPVSGGPSGAKSRQLALWVAGERAEYDRHKAVLDAIADQVAYIGPIGAGTVAKLVHNMSGFAIMAALAETFTLGVKAGVDPIALWEAVRQGAFGRKRAFDRLAEQFLRGTYDPAAFALKLGHKDASLAVELAREMNVPFKLSAMVQSEMTEAVNRAGWPELDSRVYMRLQEERAGVRIAEPDSRIQDVLKRG